MVCHVAQAFKVKLLRVISAKQINMEHCDIKKLTSAKSEPVKMEQCSGRSHVWLNFVKVLIDDEYCAHVKCRACESLLRWDSRHGTSGLLAHTKSCSVLKRNSSGNQTITSTSGFTAVSNRHAFSKTDKHDLADVIVEICAKDIRPFSIVEGAGFKLLQEKLVSLGAKYGNVDV